MLATVPVSASGAHHHQPTSANPADACLPVFQVSWQAFFVKPPYSTIGYGAHLHCQTAAQVTASVGGTAQCMQSLGHWTAIAMEVCLPSRRECFLNYAFSLDQCKARQPIDVEGVVKVWQ